MKIIKRSGAEVVFDITKIIAAVTKANNVVAENNRLTREQINTIASNVEAQCQSCGHTVNVEEIQDMVEDQIMMQGAFEVARKYITYRYVQSLKRQSNTTDERILSLIECNNEEVKQENANKNPTVNSVQRDYMAGEVSKDLTDRAAAAAGYCGGAQGRADSLPRRRLLCAAYAQLRPGEPGGYAAKRHGDFRDVHRKTAQLFHRVQHRDADHRAGGVQPIRRAEHQPGAFGSVCGGVAAKKSPPTWSRKFMGLDVPASREKIAGGAPAAAGDQPRGADDSVPGGDADDHQRPGAVCHGVYVPERGDATSRRKGTWPSLSRRRSASGIEGVKNEDGVWITPAFPKLIYVLEEDNIHPEAPYYYLTELAAKCTAKRMVPDYISEKIMKELKVDKNGEGHCYTCMGCRSFLTPYVDENGKPKYYGRFNQGVVTINLVDVALSSGRDMNEILGDF